MSIKKILIIGFGSIGRRHYEIAKNKYPEAEIKILRSSETKDSELKNTFFKTEDAIDFDPQLVVVANPASFHISSALPFIKEERYFLIEKPLSIQMDDAEFFLKKCCEKKSIVQVGYNLRFLSSLKFFKKCIHDKLIGDLWSVRSEVVQYLPSWRTNLDYRESVSGQAFLGGGVINELSHEIDYLLWLFGNVEWVSAITSKQSDLEIDVEDSAHIIISFVKNNNNVIASLNMDFIRRDRKRECIVIGSKGSIKWDGLSGKVFEWKDKDTSWNEIFSLEDLDKSYEYEWDNLEKSYNSKIKPDIDGYEGLRTLNLIDLIKKSATLNGEIIKK